MSTKILLADDSITIQKVIGIIFGGEDYSLTIVDNGKAALEKALEVSPDIMLIDALMPGISGYEVCERVRATPELATIPILLLTGSFEPFDETKAKKCGADDFIAKPFESQQIIAKVTELCERSALSVSEAEIVTEEVAVPEEIQPFAPVVAPEEPKTEAAVPPASIWDAFTPSEPPVEEAPVPAVEQEQTYFETQPAEPLESPWVPIDEKSFEFGEESAEATRATFGEPGLADEVAFEAPKFETLSESPVPPVDQAVFPEEPPPAPPEPFGAAPAPATLNEEQLKAAISTLSRDVIERIVWEVVPDLAENMIREAIRRITEAKQ